MIRFCVVVAGVQLQRPGLRRHGYCPALVCWLAIAYICQILRLVGCAVDGEGVLGLHYLQPRMVLLEEQANLYFIRMASLAIMQNQRFWRSCWVELLLGS